MRGTVANLTATDNLLQLTSEQGKVLLANCYGNIQLSNGTSFSMHAMERKSRVTNRAASITAGGNTVLPHMELRAIVLQPGMVKVTLHVTNTTPETLYVERLDALVCPSGYRMIPTRELFVRRTGWQTFSPAAVRAPFTADDPWLQPPLYAPMVLPSSAQEKHLPWMTVLQSDNTPPLLMGFGKASDYLGMINIRSSSHGHRIAAANYLEGVALPAGQTIISEPLIIAWDSPEQALLESYGTFIQHAMDARVAKQAPTGWSHWLYYFAKVTEKDILENTRIAQEKQLPFEYIQVDDGYQTMFGDWLSINDKFPHGMKYVADRIREAGFKPGIWLSPFMADARSQVVADHPEWFLHDAEGRLINVNRHGDPYWPAANYGLDLTHPEAYKWLKNVIRTMCQEWGYEYLKIDFLYAGAIRAKRYDPNCTSVQAYRRGLELIRSVAGDRVILGCGAPLLCSTGLVDNMRIGPDLSWEFDSPGVTPPPDLTRPTSREPLLSLFSHIWMNKKLWINDSDYVRTRQHDISLGWTETVALTALIAMGGGALYDSDKLATLEDDGYNLLNRLFPVADIAAKPIGKVHGKPAKLLVRSQKGSGAWHIAARFNWQDQPMTCWFYPSRWELPQARYHLYDLIQQRYLGVHRYAKIGQIQPRGVSLYSLCKATDQPQVIATEGHLLGPAGDLADVTWQDNTLRISLHPNTQADPKLFVHIPAQYKLVSRQDCVVLEKKGTVYKLQPTEQTCSLTCVPRIHTAVQKSTQHLRRALPKNP